MKRVVIFLSIFIFVVLTVALYGIYVQNKEQYKNWQTIDIDNFGTIELPEDFKLNVDDNLNGYVTKGEKEVMIIYANGNIPSDIAYVKRLENVNYSNSATLYLNEYIIDDIATQKYAIKIWNNQHLNFIIMDDSIKKDEVVKIAKSYVMK